MPITVTVIDAEEIEWMFPGGGSRFPWWGEDPVMGNLMNLLEHLQDHIAETTTEPWPDLAAQGQIALPRAGVEEVRSGFKITFGEGPGRSVIDLPWHSPTR